MESYNGGNNSKHFLPIPLPNISLVNQIIHLQQSAATPTIKMNKQLPRQLQHAPPSHKRHDNGPTFPHKLYMMLELADRVGLSHIVTWLPDERSFQIVDHDRFMLSVHPHFFKATKFRSFIRQLNLWDFERMPTMHDNHWYHKSFIRGRPDLLSGIIRTKIKGRVTVTRLGRTSSKQQSNCEDIDHKTTLPEDSVNTVSPGSYATTGAASSHVMFSDEELQEKMKEIFSINDDEPHQFERKVSLDESYNNVNLNEIMLFLPASIGMVEPRCIKEVEAQMDFSSHWDSLDNEIEPLSLTAVNQLGLESQEDFQDFLRALIK